MNNYNEKYFYMRVRGNLNYKSLKDFFALFNVAKTKMNYLIANNCCFINGEVATYDSILKQNDYLMIDITKYESLDYLPINKQIQILYEDDYLLIINKPCGYIIYPDDKTKTNTIANFVAHYYQTKQMDITIRHCHRLDNNTTGCLIFAKDLITHSIIDKMFANHQIEKTYLAIVEGMMHGKGTINKPISKDRHINGKMIIHPNGLNALTSYEVISTSQKASLLSIKIQTGRTHQIRVHMSSLLHPLYGDKLYGAVTDSHIMLHCLSLKFNHPILGKKVYIKAPVSQEFNEILKKESLTVKTKQ